MLEWVRNAHETSVWTTSVCTGSLILGAAGLLEGRPATTHWLAYERLAACGATPTEQRVVVDGNIVTAAGVAAGIDMALALAARLQGDEVAMAIQIGIEYDPQPPLDRSPASSAGASRDAVDGRGSAMVMPTILAAQPPAGDVAAEGPTPSPARRAAHRPGRRRPR